MSDNYRDGWSKKWTIGWALVQLVYLAAWRTDPLNRKGQR